MVTTKEIGKIFSEARKSRQISVEEVSRKNRIHPDVVKDIESGVFDRLGKTYIKSFLKKYSQALDLNTEEIIKKYDSISDSIASREFKLGELENKEEKAPGERNDIFSFFTEKRLQVAVAVILSVVLVSLVFILIGMIRSRMSPPEKVTRQTTSKVARKPVPVVKKEVPKQAIVKEPAPKPAPTTVKAQAPSIQAKDSVILTIKARGEVWLQVQNGSEIVFSGTMKAGDSETWDSDKTLTVWTGKADMLDFYVNTRRIGMVAAGVVRNIKVSSEGIQIGDAWVTRLN